MVFWLDGAEIHRAQCFIHAENWLQVSHRLASLFVNLVPFRAVIHFIVYW